MLQKDAHINTGINNLHPRVKVMANPLEEWPRLVSLFERPIADNYWSERFRVAANRGIIELLAKFMSIKA